MVSEKRKTVSKKETISNKKNKIEVCIINYYILYKLKKNKKKPLFIN